jgi:phosphoadenosine phosphosulfate reductase
MYVEATPLFGPTRLEMSLDRIRQFEPPEGYYLAFSGGKDSVCLLRLAEMAGVKFDAHFNLTSVDPPELVRFVREQYPQVQCHKPRHSLFQLMMTRAHQWPPTRLIRWCCEDLKETGGKGRVLLTGIRWEESPRRKQRKIVDACLHGGNKTFVNPIIDWASGQVWQFIHDQQIPYCTLYDEGFDRIGCILCPFNEQPKRDIARWPRFARAYIHAFDRLIRVRAKHGKTTSFTTGQQMFDWWISRRRAVPREQQRLFD